jgi:membrane protease YdiL (CAAX protease family)
MLVFVYFVAYLFSCLGLAIVLVPLIQPWVFDPVGLKPESALYRFAMLVALLGMPFFLRLLSLNNWQAAGFTLSRRDAWPVLGKGLLIGIVIMVALTTTQTLLDIRHFAPSPDKWGATYFARVVVSGLISGLAVGLIEETFFRGLMHTGMRRRLSFWPTAIVTALLYAALHFMKPEPLGSASFNSTTALESVATGLGRVGDFAPIADSFVTLVMVGLFLSMVRERSGNVIWAIAIHAGWVMIIKLTKYLTDTSYVGGQASFWVGEYDHITGWMATLWLGVIAAAYWIYSKPKE